MPAYIQETGRSFPNPIKGGGFNQTFKRPASSKYRTSSDYPGQTTDNAGSMNYSVTFEDGGPGSLPMGKDNIHYIGDEEPTNVTRGDERVGIYRFYRAPKDDHKYSRDPQLIKRDFGCENESWQRAASGYNPEPRSGKPVFYVMISQVPNSLPLKAFYSHWPDDTQLCVGTNVPTGLNGVGCGRNKYKEVDTLGYVFATEADALANCSPGESPKPIYEYLHPDPDHFYTIDPANEVRLADNSPIPPAESLDKSYNYLGIIGWAFETRALDAPTDTIVDVGRIGPTGMCIDKSGWYDYSFGSQATWNGIVNGMGAWTEFMYLQMRDATGVSVEGPPNVNGWGWPDNVDVLDNEALFEWSYGLSGAVKGAIPRFLGFEDMYDSQFVFYLYDTSNPWNGPIYSTQYILSNAQCCPNTTDPEGCPQCAPVWTYHSHFYEINSDVWNTTKTTLSLHDSDSKGVNESFWTVDTDTPIVFFRYTTRTGDFKPGERINGWDIVTVYYFGDELKCGIMELTWDASKDNVWYVNPAALAWRITDSNGAELTNSITERGAWVGVGTPTNPANGWTSHMKSYGIYPSVPADEVVDPLIGVWQVHTATFTIATAGTYSLRIESDNYGYMKITDSGSTVLVDREINYSNGVGNETFPMTLGAGTYTLETRVKNINRDPNPTPFTYEQEFTSENSAEAKVLAGYGIPNKSAFCGTYEFPKKISYWKVEIDPKALIPHRNMDEAKLEAVVGDDGTIVAVIIINGGRGYVSPMIKVMDPQGLDEFSANDSAEFMADKLGMDPDYEKALGDETKEDQSYTTRDMKTFARRWESATTVVNTEDKNNDLYTLDRAEVEITELSALGEIKNVRVVHGGSGYSQANNPIVHVVDPEKIKFQGVEDSQGDFQAGGKQLLAASGKMDSAWDHSFSSGDVNYNSARVESKPWTVAPLSATIDQGGSQVREIVAESMNYSPNTPANNATQVYVEVPDSYIRAAADGIDDDKTLLCFNLPPECIEIDAKANLKATMPDAQTFQYVSQDSGVKQFQDGNFAKAQDAINQVDTFGDNMSHLYGPFGKKECLEVTQPKLYNITRWFDMPCAYLDANEEGERKAFGWLPYKYCASQQKEATFRVSMEIEGYVGGSQGPAFMDFLHEMPPPFLQQKRDIATNAGEKTWKCKRSSIDGRCYRDPQDPGNMVFVPVGLDENTYDYNRSNYTELEQLQMWAGDNITSSAAVQTWLGHPTANDPAGTPHSVDYTALTVAACTNNVPPNECWDTYVRGVNASDGPLTVYCGYDANGNGLAGQTYCNVPELHNNPCLALDKCMDASIAINPKRMTGSGSTARLQLGAYNGRMTVRNWLTGGVIALGRSLKNYGNPFFDECNETDSWTDGTTLNDTIFPKRL